MAKDRDEIVALAEEADRLLERASILKLTTATYLLRMAKLELWTRAEDEEGNDSTPQNRSP